MIPTPFQFANVTLQAPDGMAECQPLPVWTDSARVVSAWLPSPEELADLQAGKPLYLTVVGRQPPVSLSTACPLSLVPEGVN